MLSAPSVQKSQNVLSELDTVQNGFVVDRQRLAVPRPGFTAETT